MIIIRTALPNDAENIRKISLSRTITSNSNERSGLINYLVPSIQEYAIRISKARFYVAENDVIGELVGFMDCFQDSILKEVLRNDIVVNRIIEIEKDPLVYSNTLALLKKYEGKGISQRLFKEVIENIPGNFKYLWGSIVHKPKINIGSVVFSKRVGFKLIEEFTNPSEITFGLYRKTLS